MNILPIPALDGGHVLFLLFEMITGRKPSDKFLEYAQIVGMVILFSLLIYANGNDLLTFTKLIQGDPERKDFLAGFYPQMVSGKLGLKFSF